jgi:hypothetical protein
MKGQWKGSYVGSPNGVIVVNIDELPNCFEGTAYLHPTQTDTGTIPRSEVVFRTTDKRTDSFKFSTPYLFALHPDTHERVPFEKIRHLYAPDAYMSQRVDVTGRVENDILHLAWVNENGAAGHCALRRDDATTPSALVGKEVTWEEFKARATRLAREDRYIFRGQGKPWRLRTAFHRRGRCDLRRFLENDVGKLHQVLSARTRHLFDLKDPQQNAAFVSLAQHHGYPTPLLDWTRSPFVAAFFAFKNISRTAARTSEANERVRIHVFDYGRWIATTQQIWRVTAPMLHVSLIEMLAIENERQIPQQAVSLLTNVDDIESYLADRERNNKITEPYLRALDIPVADREMVMNELRIMGITAGAMFPGLDGACEELREYNFPD